MYKDMKHKHLLLAFLLAGLLSFSCYTTFGTPGMRTESDYSDYYSQDETSEYGVNQYQNQGTHEDEVLYQQYDHDLSLSYYDAPLYMDSYWYEPYWYYTMNNWWDPFYSSHYHFGYYDPFRLSYYPYFYAHRPWNSFYFGFGHSSYYGYYGSGFYSYGFYSPFYGHGSYVRSEPYKRRTVARRSIYTSDRQLRTVMTSTGPSVVTSRSRNYDTSDSRSRDQSGSAYSSSRSRTISTAPRSDVVTIRKPSSSDNNSSRTYVRTRSSSRTRRERRSRSSATRRYSGASPRSA